MEPVGPSPRFSWPIGNLPKKQVRSKIGEVLDVDGLPQDDLRVMSLEGGAFKYVWNVDQGK